MELVSRDLQQAIDADREALAKDKAKLRTIIDRVLLPHFDSDYAARMVLGRHWRDATEDQRKRFIEAFYQSLMADYGDALLQFNREQLKILPFRGDPAANTATVRTEVMREGKVVPVNFTLRSTPQGWKAWDVTIEGISYARNFRNDFGTEVDQQGLEHLIKRLEAQNAGAAPRPPPPAPTPNSASKPAARTG
jgi:phospholipid transport system substrate-binding protein